MSWTGEERSRRGQKERIEEEGGEEEGRRGEKEKKRGGGEEGRRGREKRRREEMSCHEPIRRQDPVR